MKNQSKSIIKLLFINLLLISCSNNGPTENKTWKDMPLGDKASLLVFDLNEMPELSTVNLSEIGAIVIDYIPLQTTSLSAISRINNIIFGNSYFLIYDYTNVKMFNYDGSFVTRVGTKGRGPTEYMGVADVDINPETESVYIASGEKFLVYSKNGEFVRTFKNPQKSDSKNFRFTEDGILCYYFNNFGNIVNSYILMDTIGNIIKEFPNRYPWKRKAPGVFYQGENLFYKYNNQLFKKEIYCDTIFSFKGKVFVPHMVIDVGKRRLTPDIRSKFRINPDFSEKAYKSYLTPWNLFEFGDFIYYEMIMVLNGAENLFSFIGSKRDNFRALIVPEQGMNDDLYGGPNFWPRTIKGDSIIISWVEAMKFREYIASDTFEKSNPKFPEKKGDLENLADSLKDTDNPVLVLVRVEK